MDEMACNVGQISTVPHAALGSQHSLMWFPCRVIPSHPTMTALSRSAVRPRRSTAKPQRFVLNNGLTVLLQENHSAPVVALNMWVQVESIYEGNAEAGISHVYEHMLFKGTMTRGGGKIPQEIKGWGGDINAFPSFDHRVSHIPRASRYLDTGLAV